MSFLVGEDEKVTSESELELELSELELDVDFLAVFFLAAPELLADDEAAALGGVFFTPLGLMTILFLFAAAEVFFEGEGEIFDFLDDGEGPKSHKSVNHIFKSK